MLDKPNPRFGWTPERVDLLTRLWEDGYSASEIARQLGGGVTRNGVIGKAHRTGLAGRARATPKAPSSKPPKRPRNRREPTSPMAARPITGKGRSNPVPVARKPPRAPMPVEPKLDPADGVDVTYLVGVLDLNDRVCRFPVGDPLGPGFGFCGKPVTTEGRVYCDVHHRWTHQPL